MVSCCSVTCRESFAISYSCVPCSGSYNGELQLCNLKWSFITEDRRCETCSGSLSWLRAVACIAQW